MDPKPDLKSFVGQKVGPYREVVSSERVTAFVKAVGATPNAHLPPTFFTTCRKGEFELFQKLGIPLSRVLHGEQEYIYGEPAQVGSVLTYETTVAQAFEKRGSSSAMIFLVFETLIRAGEGSSAPLACTSRTTVILRGGL